MSKEAKIVLTINNEELPITQCRKFEAGYYKIGDTSVENSGDCYLINNKYYRMETGQIVFDNEVNQHVVKNDSIVNGILEFDKTGYKLGYFSLTDKNVLVHTPNGNYYAFSELLFEGNKLYRERLSNGEYYHIDTLDAREFNKLKQPTQGYKTSLPYDSKGILKDFVAKYDKLEIPINENVEKYSKVLEDLTFGLEFETTAGFIPERILNQSGLIPLRDGSISGIEYVTVPLQGSKGLQTAINACDILNKRTDYNDTCALHLHIGNIPRTKEFILAFFKLTCAIQDDIFSMFPLYKKYNFGVKNKNYSKPYPVYQLLSQMDCVITRDNINTNFDILYRYLTQDSQSFRDVGYDLNNIMTHPLDPADNQKWLIKGRYYNTNLIPLIFCNKQTVEFRIHTPTFEVNKVVPFIFMNAMIVNYAIKFQNEILTTPNFIAKKNLSRIITDVIRHTRDIQDIGTFHESMIGYIGERISYTEQQNREGSIRGNEKDIPCCRYIDWNIKTNQLKQKNIPTNTLEMLRSPKPKTVTVNATDFWGDGVRTVVKQKGEVKIESSNTESLPW